LAFLSSTKQQLLLSRFKVTKYIEVNNKTALNIARVKPYFKIANEPENPISERRNGLQKGHVTLKKLRKAPINPTFADFNALCLFFMANTCNEIRTPPKTEKRTTKAMLTFVKE